MQFPEARRLMKEAMLPVEKKIDKNEVQEEGTPPAEWQNANALRKDGRQKARSRQIPDAWNESSLKDKTAEIQHPIPSLVCRHGIAPAQGEFSCEQEAEGKKGNDEKPTHARDKLQVRRAFGNEQSGLLGGLP